MPIPVGICTTKDVVFPRSSHQLITEYTEANYSKILYSKLGIEKFEPELFETIKRSIKSQDIILLEVAGHNYGYEQQLNELAVMLSAKWPVGSHIKVKFLNGDPQYYPLIFKYAKEWETHAQITFDFIDSGAADVRISLTNDLNSWSFIGKECLTITDQSKPTINFGCFINSISLAEKRSTVLHEFGHVLGCVHEHQQPAANMAWDEAAILRAYSIIPGWDEQKVRHNILNKLPQSNIANSSYDQYSIMHYYFPAHFMLNGIGSNMNLNLSQGDIDFIEFCYPF
jgi:hypothetical protein